MKIKNLIHAALSLFLLTGCSGEPSESNMLTAVQNNDKIKMQLSMLVGMASSLGQPRGAERDLMSIGDRENANGQSENHNQAVSTEELVSNILENMAIEKSDCVEANGSPGFMCDFRMQTTFQDKKEWSKPTKGRFFKTGDGWNYEEIKS